VVALALFGCSAAGLSPLVDWNTRRELDIKVAELQDSLSSMMASEPPHPAGDIIAFVKARKQEQVWGCRALWQGSVCSLQWQLVTAVCCAVAA